ncbi:hypothetical protein FHN97_21160 [Salmonella enterica]|uniref:hypothetical protein n=1 Tax=Salmonella enterica TaxID=28901 RepID=UPI0009AEAF1E|nr:hypothetical protein [Salmonella enterica]EBG6962262.1 hypothetical protein [Salmonella enterica subsp. enterica]EBS3176956.1 hypothetical protein [Salmonella enterica subsp. enterica serovar Newport]EBS3869060.1 hypothetical protein [Salmonella enterica subsp. enterica serovar Kimberley]EBU7004881.1 hypothetical protein [Salmonella enterica subsp. enterica serovar Kintambo]ECH8659948.1 hypothetical protein [Salmonella enterica subsp. enterica serovar Nagoya]EDE2461926.1 hypothetical prote
MTVTIVSPSAAAVKPRRHSRIIRPDIPAPEIDPALKAFGRHIARSYRRGRGVHIPAMKNTAFGQVLRTLELKRAFN